MKKRIITLTLFLLIILLIGIISAEKLEIKINSFKDINLDFKIFLYDNENNKINGEINYIIQDYYTDIVDKGRVNSGEEINFKLPKNPAQGPWKITANYKDTAINELFNVGKIEKINISLDQDNLILENIGNVPYEKNILIYIGNHAETARVFLEIGQTKKIRLTAPSGKYTVKVDDGSEQNKIVFSDVSLTGNVVGLEKIIEGNFWNRYPIVSLFLTALLLVIIVVVGLKFLKKSNK